MQFKMEKKLLFMMKVHSSLIKKRNLRKNNRIDKEIKTD